MYLQSVFSNNTLRTRHPTVAICCYAVINSIAKKSWGGVSFPSNQIADDVTVRIVW